MHVQINHCVYNLGCTEMFQPFGEFVTRVVRSCVLVATYQINSRQCEQKVG